MQDVRGPVSVPPPCSLIHGVEEAVCAALGIARLRHRSALSSLRISADSDVARIVYSVVERNWVAGDASANLDRSRQNWRWALQPWIGAANASPEVILERAIAAACAASGRTDWANQIPVASGLIAGASDRRRAIDLAQRTGEQSYELIELKIGSDTPLFAAVELLGYASIWILARQNPPAQRPELLRARQIALRVLAPAAYYAPFDLIALEEVIGHSIRALGVREDVEMSFGFDMLPESLSQVPPPEGVALLDTLAARRPLYDGRRGWRGHSEVCSF